MTDNNLKNAGKKAIDSSTNYEYDVFVVDDNFDQANIIKLLIEQSGLKANFTTDSEAAYQTIIKDKPRLVILDLMMPGTTGFIVCKKYRERYGTDLTKILAITGYDTPENRSRILECGANDYLSKPFSLESIKKKIESFNLSA